MMKNALGWAPVVLLGALCVAGCGRASKAGREESAQSTRAPETQRAETAGAKQPPATGGAKMIPLELVLPKPQFIGTPQQIKVANLEPSSPTQRPPFLVPEGVVNLAKGKTVTSSENFPLLGDLTMVTDGDKEGRDGSYIEVSPGKQWVQIDLGAPSELYAVVLWLYHGQQRAYHDVVVQVSDDPGMAGSQIIYNNDHDNSSGFGVGKEKAYIESHMGRIIDAKGVKARYVRVNTRGNTSDEMNHFTEVEIYGRAVK